MDTINNSPAIQTVETTNAIASQPSAATKRISHSQILKQAFVIYKKQWKLLSFLTLAFYLINMVMSYSSEQLKNQNYIYLAVSLLNYFITTIMVTGITNIALKLSNDQTVGFKDIWIGSKKLVTSIIATFIAQIFCLIGFLFLILPGIYLEYRFTFLVTVIVDKGFGVRQALKNSWKMTKGETLDLFLFTIYLGFVILIGALLLLVGLVAAIPTTVIATALYYRQLSDLYFKHTQVT